MRPSIRSRLIALVRAQWAGLLALFLVIAGGTAYAANTIGSSDIIDESILSQDIKNGQVKTADLGNNQVYSADVRDDTLPNGGLTGADVKDQSGVDTCVSTVRIGQLCFRAENLARPWFQAIQHCANLDLRAPTLAEAIELAKTHDLPNIDPGEKFWTGEHYYLTDGEWADNMSEGGSLGASPVSVSWETVCVTTPTN